MSRLKKLTILHSNDLHGDFMSNNIDDTLVGGISMLSGYVEKVRAEEENVIYVVAGDMFQGSLIDSEYKGISTISLMNMIAPDVATIGNHEVDYGLAHMLFIEKCAAFPIINANMYIKDNYKRMFNSHVILEVGGMKILFIGIVTEEVLAMAKKEELLGSLITVEDAANEIGKICDAYSTDEIDFTVVLTHIGIEADKRLAKALNPNWGVDIIIGGHSHTLLSEPVTVNGIPIAQAASGTEQIGRFDISIDVESSSIKEYTWRLISINEKNCPKDPEVEELLSFYRDKTEEKYLQVVTKFARKYTHPSKHEETELGRLFSDIFKEGTGVDLMLFASGSLRKKELGPVVTLKNYMEILPFHEEIYRITVTGAQLRKMLAYMFREEAFNPDNHTEHYQLSEGIQVTYSLSEKKIISVKWKGGELADDERINVGIQEFHFHGMKDFLGITLEEVLVNGPADIIVTAGNEACLEWLKDRNVIRASEKQRVVFVK